MKSYFKLINTNTGGNRNDITPLFQNFNAFRDLIDNMAGKIKGLNFDYIASIDALGFIIGTALCFKFKKGLITLRKGGKLPVESDRIAFIDYTKMDKNDQTKELFEKYNCITLSDGKIMEI